MLTAIRSGRASHPNDRILDDRKQWNAEQVAELLRDLVDALLPKLFGPEGEHRGWVERINSEPVPIELVSRG